MDSADVAGLGVDFGECLAWIGRGGDRLVGNRAGQFDLPSDQSARIRQPVRLCYGDRWEALEDLYGPDDLDAPLPLLFLVCAVHELPGRIPRWIHATGLWHVETDAAYARSD